MRGNGRSCFAGGAPRSDADDPAPETTQLRSGCLDSQIVDETKTEHDPEPDSEGQAANHRDILRGKERWPTGRWQERTPL